MKQAIRRAAQLLGESDEDRRWSSLRPYGYGLLYPGEWFWVWYDDQLLAGEAAQTAEAPHPAVMSHSSTNTTHLANTTDKGAATSTSNAAVNTKNVVVTAEAIDSAMAAVATKMTNAAGVPQIRVTFRARLDRGKP